MMLVERLAEVNALGIELGTHWDWPTHEPCREFAIPLYDQMSSGKYDECATMPLPQSREAWESEHRTARKRAWRAERLGYRFAEFKPADWAMDIHRINTSSDWRQGRPMSASYRTPREWGDESYPCEIHAVRRYGVFGAARLVAYLFMYRAGDLALVSQVLGHADHEEHGIMQLLFREALMAESLVAPGVCVYNRWDSGKDGLRQAKGWVGFEPTPVEWLP